MSPENDKYLCEKYPKIFADRRASMTTTAMCWGFCCGDGWLSLIDTLCGTIQAHIDHSNEERQRRTLLSQIYHEAREGRWEKFEHYYKDFSPDFIESMKNRIHDDLPIPSEIPQVVATQVKEKFGQLCFYYYGGDDFVYGAVSIAESLSYKICELCGSPGVPNSAGWIRVLCHSCRIKDQ